MGNGRVICAKPRTFFDILPIEILEIDHEVTKDLLSSVGGVVIKHLYEKMKSLFEEKREENKKKKTSFYHNSIKYQFLIEEERVKIYSDGSDQEIDYIDGILQDLSTSELFYFLAIDGGEVNSKLIDEGTEIEYEKEYKGVAKINLYKGNTGHKDAREELLVASDLFEEAERVIGDKTTEQKKTEMARNIIDKKEDIYELKPVFVRTEIVRYVEVRSVISIV